VTELGCKSGRPGPARQKRLQCLSVCLHFQNYLLLPNLPKLLSTKQTDTVQNVIAAPRGPGGQHGGTGREGLGEEILGYGFQDKVFTTWDLNFGAWIFTLVVSKIET